MMPPRPMSHDDIADLLGVYALDALEPDEAELVERHLPTCPKCRAEVAEHREVAGLLGFAGQEAPAGLWERITDSMQEAPPEVVLSRVDSGEVVHLDAGRADRSATTPGSAHAARSAERRRSRANRRLATVRVRTVAALAAAAAAIVAVLGVQLARLDHREGSLERSMAASGAQGPSMQAVQAALRTPGARQVTLLAMSPGQTVKAVVLPGGQGYLYDAKLAPLPSSETYQLWGVTSGAVVSYGLIGSAAPRVVAFQAGSGVQALAVTAEVAGGVVRSTHAPVAAGPVNPPL